MAQEYSIAQIIDIGEASTYLSIIYNSEGSLYGQRIGAPTSPLTIQMVTWALNSGNEGGGQTAASLRGVANYLISLCGRFYLQATQVLGIPGGGTVFPVPGTGGGTVTYVAIELP